MDCHESAPCCEEPRTALPVGPAIPTRGEMWRDILSLSWPCAVELFLASLIGIVTMALVGAIGKEAVSAIGITNQPILIPSVILQAFCVGGTALVARSLGMGDRNTARSAWEQTLLLSLLLGVAASLLMIFLGEQFIRWMGATPDYFGMAALYMKYCSVGVFFQSVSTAVSALLRGAGCTRLSMYFNVVANVLNLLLGLVLINGAGPIPAMGVHGAGIAQLAAKIAACVLAVWIMLGSRKLSVRPRVGSIFRPRFPMIRRICRIGVSSALEQLALRVGLILFTIYVIDLGTAEYAAHNIAASIHGYTVNFGQAYGIALISLVGSNLGAGRPEVASRYFSEALKLCLITSAILMLPLLIIPQYIARIFTDEKDVIVNVATALRILAFFVTQQIVQMAVCGGLRGGGDTKWPLYSTMIGVLGMRMLLGYLFIVVLDGGLAAAWWCWFLDQTTRSIIITFRFRNGKWKQVRV